MSPAASAALLGRVERVVKFSTDITPQRQAAAAVEGRMAAIDRVQR